MTIAEKFVRARTAKGLSLEDAAKESGIPARFLSALESKNLRAFSGRMYAVRYAEKYAQFLKVFDASLVDDFAREWEVYTLQLLRLVKTPSAAVQLLRFVAPYKVFILIFLGVLLPISGYFAYQISLLLSAPDLVISLPPPISVSPDNTAIIQGHIKEKVRLSLNRRPVATSDTGAFQERLYLVPGLNTIEVEAINVSGRMVSETRYIFY